MARLSDLLRQTRTCSGFIEHNGHLWRVLVFYMLSEICYEKSESETEKGPSANSSRMNDSLLKRKSMSPRRSAR